LAAFLDVSAAYDNVNCSILIQKLMEKGCPLNIVRFIEKWLYSKNTEFIINNEVKVYTQQTKMD